ncbi:MAG: hypothetical protein Kow00123_09680 [Anaerolineales bacterium]
MSVVSTMALGVAESHMPSAANCEDPAWTMADIPAVSTGDRPTALAATPYTKPNITTPGVNGRASRNPRASDADRRVALIGDI